MRVDETITYLEMTDRSQLATAEPPPLEVEVRRAEIPCPEFSRFFYTAIGGDWYWIDRLGWTYQQWTAFVARPGLETWVAYVRGTPAGYFELSGEPGGDVEIASFGLLPQFIGRGLGRYLLTVAAGRAWERNPARVWLHTCAFDHPRALANYQASGFRIVKKETRPKDIPDETPGPWPGARRATTGPRCGGNVH